MSRRAPGKDKTATPRKEADIPEILSGLIDGITTGAPLAIVIRNSDTKSNNYDNIKCQPRPNHSDFAAYVKYSGYNDIRGGGHFSARLTAPIVAAGAICRCILKDMGVTLGGHIMNIGLAYDKPFDYVNVSSEELDSLSAKLFALINPNVEEQMRAEVESARMDCDSVGGSVELAAVGIPAGVGNPMFFGVENVIASILYGIPAVKSVSFGAGEDFSRMRGSQANDSMYFEEDKVKCRTNNCGGITGGITNGMPLIVKVALKPTPSISKPQQTVNLKTGENSTLIIEGRHDPCIVPRALPALEAAFAIGILDLLREDNKL
jgi:chorismate synthase